MMCGDRWLETGSPWEGDEMTEREPTEEMIMAGINAANRSMPYINDTQMVLAIWKAMQARATPALPQGVEEWIKQNKFSALSAGEFNDVVSIRDLRALLDGMAIAPVDLLHDIETDLIMEITNIGRLQALRAIIEEEQP